MTLPQHIHYWLLQAQKMLAAEVAPTLPGHRAWIGVYPPRSDRNSFLVRYLEVDKKLIEQDVDIHEEQLKNKKTFIVSNEDDLVYVLSQWISDFDILKGPSFSDYPI